MRQGAAISSKGEATRSKTANPANMPITYKWYKMITTSSNVYWYEADTNLSSVKDDRETRVAKFTLTFSRVIVAEKEVVLKF